MVGGMLGDAVGGMVGDAVGGMVGGMVGDAVGGMVGGIVGGMVGGTQRLQCSRPRRFRRLAGGSMKHSHMTTPRTLRDGTWCEWGDPVERISRKTEAGLGVLLSCVIGILGAVVLVHWWSI